MHIGEHEMVDVHLTMHKVEHKLVDVHLAMHKGEHELVDVHLATLRVISLFVITTSNLIVTV